MSTEIILTNHNGVVKRLVDENRKIRPDTIISYEGALYRFASYSPSPFVEKMYFQQTIGVVEIVVDSVGRIV